MTSLAPATRRRAHPRVPLYVRVELRLQRWRGYGFTLNVGVGGLALQFSKAGTHNVPALSLGERVELGVYLPSVVGTIELEATVAWGPSEARSVGGRAVATFGFRFRPTKERSLAVLREFVTGFRYGVMVADVRDTSLIHDVLGEVYDVEETDRLEQLKLHVALVVLGDAHGHRKLLERVKQLTQQGDTERHVPILLLSGSWPDELETSDTGRGRVVYRRMPVESMELRTLADRCIEGHLLATENERLRLELEAALERVRRENQIFRSQLSKPSRIAGVIGNSTEMESVYRILERVAPVDTNVLVLGETGTGKELIVSGLHRLSSRAKGPFVAQNCAGIQDSLLESELFGHRRGAFTGAVADHDGLFHVANGGTVFLDEVAEMSGAMQAKLLRVLQDGDVRRIGDTRSTTVDVRVVAATHADLEERVRNGQFREDLYYRLATFVVRLPPLRERTGDIEELAAHFLAEFAARYGREVVGLSPDALELLARHRWPGNVRQLRQIMERVSILVHTDQAVDGELVREALSFDTRHGDDEAPSGPESLVMALESFERGMIVTALKRSRGVIARAAEILQIERSTLSRRCKKLGVDASDYATPEPS